MPRLAEGAVSLRVIATGGTIASLVDPETGAVRPAVGIDELLGAVPGLDALGPVRPESVASVNGWNITPATMLEVARRARDALAEGGVDGLVVTHGTDTIEETAFFCDLTVDSVKPIAFTAAMRSGDELGADGPRNLLCAATVALDPMMCGIGTVLVLGDEIHAARWARKQDSFRTGAVTSPGHGPIGFVKPGSVRTALGRPGRVNVGLPDAFDVHVPVLQTYTGLEAEVLGALIDASDASGVVLEGTGLGNVPGTAVPGIEAALERGLPVVIATRVPTGGTGPVYGGQGGGATLRDLGVIEAGSLSAAKARLLLMLLLASGDDDVRERFVEAARRLAAW